MTRRGKIARLPSALRAALNQRLQDGRPGPELLDWLNALPEVQAILQKEFDGQPISQPNLSRWKTGGYEAWEQEQQALDKLDTASAEDTTAKAAAAPVLADRLSSFLVLQMAVELCRAEDVPSGPPKAAIHAEMIKNLCGLRRGDREGARSRLDEQKYRLGLFQEGEQERARRKQEARDNMTEEERQERINRILGAD
ncbi:MAG TPA: hypothetical protein VGO59_15420 [Verrucomicrobiae bacterium]|jgi:hypothetical protein